MTADPETSVADALDALLEAGDGATLIGYLPTGKSGQRIERGVRARAPQRVGLPITGTAEEPFVRSGRGGTVRSQQREAPSGLRHAPAGLRGQRRR
jgi:hypothetical protein